MSSNVTLHGKHYQSGNILPIAINSAGELIIDSGGAIDLANLGDVSIAGLANNNLLQYDGTVSYWVNRSSLAGNLGFESQHTTQTASFNNVWVSGLSNLANVTAGNLVVTELSNLANVLINGNLDVLGTSNLANVSAGNLVVTELSNLANVLVNGNLDVLGTSNLANVSAGNLVVTELSNLANVLVNGNLDVLGTSNLANVSMGNLFVTELSNLANVLINGNLDVLGHTELANLSAGNLEVSGTANISGDTTLNSNLLITGEHYTFFTDANTYIHGQTAGGNLDITNLAGNVNIRANTDIILTTNTGSTIKLVGPTEQMLAVSQPSTGNIYMNFGANVGNLGYGIWSDNGVLKRKNQTDPGWVELSSGTGGASNLANLGDVQFALPLANNEILAYDSTLSKWTNSTLGDVVAQIGYYGVFYDTSNQYNIPANTSRPMKCNSTAEAKGVSVDTNGVFTVDNAGVYNIQFSTQLTKTDSGNDIVDIWFRKNGSNIAESNTEYTVVGNNGRSVAALNYVLTLAANNTIEIMWRAADSHITLLHQDATANVPATPSVIVTITPVQYIQNGTLNLGDLLNVSTTGQANNHVLQYNSALSRWDTRTNLTIEPGSLAIFGPSANISSNAATGNLVINAGNLDISAATGLTHIHNNLLVSGNLSVNGLSNLANVGISGNLDVLGHTGLTNLSVGNLIVRDDGKIEFRDANTYINSGSTGNLDIRSLYGNINITANHDIIISANTPSTIKLLGPGNSPMVAFSQDAGGNTFMSFGSTTGESGYGIKADASGNVLIKSQGASGWAGVSNTTIAIGNTSISLGNTYAGLDLSNSRGYQTSNLVGTITNTQLSGSISNAKLANSNIVIGGQTINLGGTGNLAFSNITGSLNTGTQIDAGNIANAKLANSNIVIGGQTINLGGSGNLAFSNITGSLNTGTQIVNGNIANAKLANSNIVIGGQTINLGGSGNIRLSNLSDVSISETPSNGSVLKYNTGTSVWEPFAPQFISILFPTAAVARIGSVISAANISVANVNMTYNQLANNTVVSGNPNNCWEFQNLSNGFYKFSASFTYQNDGGAADTGFYVRFYEANAYVVQTADSAYTTGSSSGNTSFSIIRDYRAAIPSNVGIIFLNEPANVLNYYLKGCTVLAERLIF